MHTPDSAATIALFPLQTVLFPGCLLPLQIFEARYIDLVRDCLRTNQGFGVVPIKEGREAGGPAIPFLMGTYAEIADWSQGTNGLLNILTRGTRRFRIRAHDVASNHLLMASVEWRDSPGVTATPDEYAELRALLHKLLEHNHAIDQANELARLSNTEFVYRVAEMLPFTLAQKVELLSLEDDRALLTCMEIFLSQLRIRHASTH